MKKKFKKIYNEITRKRKKERKKEKDYGLFDLTMIGLMH
jgi:hypothetical protein